jgi:hypothetical protein
MEFCRNLANLGTMGSSAIVHLKQRAAQEGTRASPLPYPLPQERCYYLAKDSLFCMRSGISNSRPRGFQWRAHGFGPRASRARGSWALGQGACARRIFIHTYIHTGILKHSRLPVFFLFFVCFGGYVWENATGERRGTLAEAERCSS